MNLKVTSCKSSKSDLIFEFFVESCACIVGVYLYLTGSAIIFPLPGLVKMITRGDELADGGAILRASVLVWRGMPRPLFTPRQENKLATRGDV